VAEWIFEDTKKKSSGLLLSIQTALLKLSKLSPPSLGMVLSGDNMLEVVVVV